MDNELESYFGEIIAERTSDILAALQKNDGEYQKWYRKMVDNSGAIEKIKEGDFDFSVDDFSSVKSYISAVNEISLIEHFTLYAGGYVDCIRLLKKLQV